jgi:hypothetical protein
MNLEISRQIFEKYVNIKFYENQYRGTRVVHADVQTYNEGRVGFRNFARA